VLASGVKSIPERDCVSPAMMTMMMVMMMTVMVVMMM
jgi:hypothetical protein